MSETTKTRRGEVSHLFAAFMCFFLRKGKKRLQRKTSTNLAELYTVSLLCRLPNVFHPPENERIHLPNVRFFREELAVSFRETYTNWWMVSASNLSRAIYI